MVNLFSALCAPLSVFLISRGPHDPYKHFRIYFFANNNRHYELHILRVYYSVINQFSTLKFISVSFLTTNRLILR